MARRTISDEQILAQVPSARRRAGVGSARTTARTSALVGASRHADQWRDVARAVDLFLLSSTLGTELADVAVGVAGVGVRWERLDEDLTIAGLARVALGRQALLQASGAVGGSVRTAAKADASRANGLKGGRPRKR